MRSRAGFTLIELMVAMALTVFLMVILSQAFVMSLETFSAMKGIGDMQMNLRVAEVMLRSDVSQDFFEGKRRLSDLNSAGQHQIVMSKPQEGFFAVRHGSTVSSTAGAAYFFEGNDANSVPSYRAVDHILYLTVKRKGNQLENFFTASMNDSSAGAAALNLFFSKQTAYNMTSADLANSTWSVQYSPGSSTGYYSSQWAEVVYYLLRSGSTEEPNNPNSIIGTPTYSLYRAQFAMVPNADNLANQFGNGLALQNTTFNALSCNPGSTALQFYTPADAANGLRVIPDLAAFAPTTNTRIFSSATLVLPNVISFHVQIMPLNNTTFQDAPPPVVGAGFGLYDTSKVSATYSTSGYTNPNANVGLKGFQATFRVWDNKTRQTRQATVVQDL